MTSRPIALLLIAAVGVGCGPNDPDQPAGVPASSPPMPATKPATEAPPKGLAKAPIRVDAGELCGLLDAMPWSATPAALAAGVPGLVLDEPSPGKFRYGCTSKTKHASGQRQCVALIDGSLDTRSVRYELTKPEALALYRALVAELDRTRGPGVTKVVLDRERCRRVSSVSEQQILTGLDDPAVAGGLSSDRLCAQTRYAFAEGVGSATLRLTPARPTSGRYRVKLLEGTPSLDTRAKSEAASDALRDATRDAIKRFQKRDQ